MRFAPPMPTVLTLEKPMPTFDTITIDEAQEIIDTLKNADAEISQAYFNGDAWQSGDAWIGPRPADDDTDGETVLEQIENGLVSKNVIAEVVGRHKDALIGQEPDWSFVPRRPMKTNERPTAAESALIDEAEAVLTDWWDSQQVLQRLQETISNLLINSYQETPTRIFARSCIRLFVPPGLVSENGQLPKQNDLAAALSLIYPHSPELFSSLVYIDPDSQERIGLYSFRVNDLINVIEENRMEVHGLDAQRRTIIRIYENEAQSTESEPLELGGNLGIFELKRERFITPQVQQLQALLNMALTMMGRNVVLGGFLERMILNAQLPGRFVDDPENPGKKIFEASEFFVGAGSTNALAGLPIYGDDNRPTRVTGYTNPNVIYRDPVPVNTFKDTKAEAYAAILEETKQIHALISKDATASGESRKQARAEFRSSLNATKPQIEAAGRWILETALAMAAQFSGQPGRFKDLRAMFQCRLDLGPMSSEDTKTVIELRDADIISTNDAMQRVGVDDPDAMAATIAKEKAENPAPVIPPIVPAVDPTKQPQPMPPNPNNGGNQ